MADNAKEALSSALEEIISATKKDFKVYFNNKRNNSTNITDKDVSTFLDNTIKANVDFYAPLSITENDKTWLIKQASEHKGDIVDSTKEETGLPKESELNNNPPSTNRNDDPSSNSGSSIAPTISASENSNGRSSMFDAMYGELGKRNAFTVHNINGRRYYSTIDATIFFNGNIIEEVVQLQWTIDEQVMPLFGYNSYIWDEVARGSRIISGAFAINFTVPDYLDQVVKGIKDNGSISFKNTGKKIEKDNHAPRWPKGFTIGIGYGSKDSVTGEQPCTFLEGVQLKSSGQALDTQGGQLVEMYQFIARDWSGQR